MVIFNSYAQYVVNSKCAKATADTIKFSNINIYLRKPASTALDCVDKTGFMSKVQNVMSYLPFPLWSVKCLNACLLFKIEALAF